MVATLILLVPLAGANGAVLEVAEIGRIGPEDGRLTDAEIDPSGALVLVVGEGGFAKRLDGDAPHRCRPFLGTSWPDLERSRSGGIAPWRSNSAVGGIPRCSLAIRGGGWVPDECQ